MTIDPMSAAKSMEVDNTRRKTVPMTLQKALKKRCIRRTTGRRMGGVSSDMVVDDDITSGYNGGVSGGEEFSGTLSIADVALSMVGSGQCDASIARDGGWDGRWWAEEGRGWVEGPKSERETDRYDMQMILY